MAPRLRDSGALAVPRRPPVPKVPGLRRADDTAAATVSMATDTTSQSQITNVNKSLTSSSSSSLRGRLATTSAANSSIQSKQVLSQSRTGEDIVFSLLTQCGLVV